MEEAFAGEIRGVNSVAAHVSTAGEGNRLRWPLGVSQKDRDGDRTPVVQTQRPPPRSSAGPPPTPRLCACACPPLSRVAGARLSARPPVGGGTAPGNGAQPPGFLLWLPVPFGPLASGPILLPPSLRNCFMGAESQFRKMKRALWADGSGGCTTVWV